MSDAYARVRGGKLSLKGGLSLGSDAGVGKKKKKKKKKPQDELAEGEEGGEGSSAQAEKPPVDHSGIDITKPGMGYEQLFPYEAKRMKEAKGRSVCFGTNYRAAPEVLHGYTSKVKGETVMERLDMRCGVKADKYCK